MVYFASTGPKQQGQIEHGLKSLKLDQNKSFFLTNYLFQVFFLQHEKANILSCACLETKSQYENFITRNGLNSFTPNPSFLIDRKTEANKMLPDLLKTYRLFLSKPELSLGGTCL